MAGAPGRRVQDWARRAAQAGVLVTFLLIPVWYRVAEAAFLPQYYVSGFVLLLPMQFTLIMWVVAGCPGIGRFARHTARLVWIGALGALAVWAYASGAWAFMATQDPTLALNAAYQMAIVAGFALAAACVSVPPRAVIAALTFGLMWNTLLAGAQSAGQSWLGLAFLGEFRVTADQPGASIIEAGGVRWLRPYGLLPHPNVLATFMGVALLASVHWLTHDRRWPVAMMIFIAGLWAFLLTFSRGAWISFAAGAFALLPLLVRARRIRYGLVLTGIAAVITGLVFVVSYTPLLLSRAGVGLENTEVYSVAERTVLMQTAMRAILDNPLVGVGAGNFPWRASYILYVSEIPMRGNNVHHVLLSAWAELGIVGVVLLGAAMIAAVEAALYQTKRHDDGRAVLLAGALMLMITGLFEHLPYNLLHIQVLWWGLLAVAQSPASMLESDL